MATGVLGDMSATPGPSHRALDDTKTIRSKIYDNVMKSASTIEPLQNSFHTLSVTDVGYEGPDNYSLLDQKKAILSGNSLMRRLKGNVTLADRNTGEPIAQRRMTIAHVPHMTDRGTFIVNGNEWTLASQSRLRPGVYTRVQANGEVESDVRTVPGKGASHTYRLDPSTGLFKFEIGQSGSPLISVLRAMGTKDSEMREAWGDEIFSRNMPHDSPHIINKLYDRMVYRPDPNAKDDDKKKALLDELGKVEFDPEVTKRTLGAPHSVLTKDAILAATKKLLAVNRLEAEPDDRDHLAYQKIMGPEDLLSERITKDRKGLRDIFYRASGKKSLDFLPPGFMSKSVMAAIQGSGLGQQVEEINLSELLDQNTRITRLGEGGIGGAGSGVPLESRNVNPSQFGFVDTIRTPESGSVGVDSRLASMARKGDDNKIYAPFRDLKTGKVDYKSTNDISEKSVAFPGEIDRARKTNGLAATLVNGRVKYLQPDKVDYELPEMEHTFSPLANMIPMKSSTKGQRVAMGSRMLTQALPLLGAESPLVQSATPEDPNVSYEERYGEKMGAVKAKQAGRVVNVTPDEIKVRYADGSVQSHELYNNHPHSRKTFAHNTSMVRPGDVVQPGQLLAKSNFTDDKGATALGLNAKIAFIPYLGKNYEDAIIMSESAAKRFCFDLGTEILTERGWVRGDEITTNDKVACLDNGFTVYEQPLTIHQYESNELMIASGRQFDIAVTPEHWLYVGDMKTRSYSKIQAKDLGKRNVSLLRSAENSNPDQEFFYLPSIIKRGNLGCGSQGRRPDRRIPPLAIPMDDWCLLFGLYIAEGWCDDPDRYSSVSVFIKQCKIRVKRVLAKLSERLGFGTLGSDDRWIWSNMQAVRYLRPLGKAKTKRLPNWVWALSKRQARLLLEGLILGDGHRLTKVVSYHASYATSSPGLADDVQRLALHCGYSANITQRLKPKRNPVFKGREIVARGPQFRVSVLEKEQRPGINTKKTRLEKISLLTPVKVWCVTTRTGVVYVRRNGKPRWCGNSSEHMYQHKMDWDPSVHKGKHVFMGIYPTKFNKAALDTLDEHGVVKPGTVVQNGDPLIAAVKEQEFSHSQVHRKRGPSFSDASTVWDHHSTGIVTDVSNTKDGVNVTVKSYNPSQMADKFCNRFGGKGVAADIIPDHEMPHDENGEPFEMALNPLGVISRGNPSQVVEMALGKIAHKHGKTYKIQDFKNIDDLTEFAQQELKKHNMSDLETVTDPRTGRKIPNVLTGRQFMMKLHHTAETKDQGRGLGSYTADETPSKGGESASKRSALMSTYALLSSGATEVLRDIHAIRGQKNTDYWAHFQAGRRPPEPKIPMVYDKLIAHLQGSGINVVRKGTQLHIMGQTNKDVGMLTGGREIKNAETVSWKDGDKPIPGGLFDPKLFGGDFGHDGRKWASISLHQPMPNPVMEEPIRRLLGLTEAKFHDVIAGKEKLPNGQSGPQGIFNSLNSINIDKAIDQARSEVKGGRKTVRDEAVKKLGFLSGAKKYGNHPRDWFMDSIPVLPPVFRPVSTMATTGSPQVADINYLYKEVWDSNENLKWAKTNKADAGQEHLTLYKAYKGVTGLGDPVQPKHQEKEIQGLLKQVFSSSPKFGMVQSKLLGSNVDIVGRATITPNPDLDMDQVGLPAERAWTIYKPFIIRRLSRGGMDPVSAAQAVTDQKPVAMHAMMTEMKERPVIIDRAPVHHRYGVMAFWPQITKGHTLQIPPVVTKGFGADFDGDAMQYHVPASDEAKEEAVIKLLPSKNLLAASTFKATNYLPSQEYVAGLYLGTTRHNKEKRPRVFATRKDAIRAFKNGEASADDPIQIVDDRS